MNFNKCIFAGRLTKDPHTFSTNSGKSGADFGLAINDGYGENKSTLFLNCVAFGKTAETLTRYAAKGGELLVEGKLTASEYTDRNGNKVKKFSLFVEGFQFGSKPAGQAAQQQYPQQAQPGQGYGYGYVNPPPEELDMIAASAPQYQPPPPPQFAPPTPPAPPPEYYTAPPVQQQTLQYGGSDSDVPF